MFHHYSLTRTIAHTLSSQSVHEHTARVQPAPDAVPALLLEREGPLHRSLPPIFSVLEVLDTSPLLRRMLATFAPPIHYAIKASLLPFDPYQPLRLQVLETLVDKTASMSNILDEAGLVSLGFLLLHECVFGMIEGMLMEPGQYRRELAFLFTQLSVYRLPPHLQHKMAISSAKLPLTVLPTYAYWFLCSAAEYRLSQAMRDHAVLLVNGAILLKFQGKLSGIALETMVLADGTQLIEGCWYAPIDQREAIREAFDRGESRLCVQGQWTLIRALSEYDDTLLQRAQTYVAALPEQFPQQIGAISRQTYRCNADEEF